MTIDSAHQAALREGHYATRQIFSKDRLVAWSHRRRFDTGLRLAQRFHGQRILDYGCGDGTFLALLCASAAPPAHAVGAELDDFQINDCRRRLGGSDRLTFESIADLDRDSHRGRYDGVVCMEVLEHVVDLDPVIDRLCRVLADDGTLIVSVPVEIGLPLLVKQTVRRVAGWRGIEEYRGTTRYTIREYVRSVFAGNSQHIDRPVYGTDRATAFHDHKGFNWKVLRARLSRRFIVVRTVVSPVSWIGPRLATQVWFELHKRS